MKKRNVLLINKRIRNEKLLEDSIAEGKNVDEEDYAAACLEMLQKRSDIKTQMEALLKSGDEGAILRSLEDAEQRLADVRASVAADKSSKDGTSPQKEPQSDNERKENNNHNVNGSQKPTNETRSQPIEEMSELAVLLAPSKFLSSNQGFVLHLTFSRTQHKDGTSPQKEPQSDNERKENNDHNVNGSQKPTNETRSQPIEEMSELAVLLAPSKFLSSNQGFVLHLTFSRTQRFCCFWVCHQTLASQGDKPKSNKTSVFSKTSSVRRIPDLKIKTLKEQEELQARLTELNQ